MDKNNTALNLQQVTTYIYARIREEITNSLAKFTIPSKSQYKVHESRYQVRQAIANDA